MITFHWHCRYMPNEIGVRLFLHTLASEYGACRKWRAAVIDPEIDLAEFTTYLYDPDWVNMPGRDAVSFKIDVATVAGRTWREADAIWDYVGGNPKDFSDILWWTLFRHMRLHGIPCSSEGYWRLFNLQKEIERHYLSDRKLYSPSTDDLPF